MKNEVFIQQELASDSRIHFHRGVWWRPIAPGVCKPVLPFQLMVPNASRPKMIKSFIGYSHLIPQGVPSNQRAEYWFIEEPQLRGYSLENLSYEKRKAISKARRSGLTFSRITDLETLWSDLKEIAISMASRTGYGRPPQYYQMCFKEWQLEIETEFAKPNREWWGIFLKGKLGAYMYAYLIEDTMYLQVTKVHSDFMSLRASDFLYYSIIDYCRGLEECKRVNTGRANEVPGVDRFKESLGFQKYEVGEYFQYNTLLTILLRLLLRFHHRVSHNACSQGQERLFDSIRSLYRHAIRMAERIELHPQKK